MIIILLIIAFMYFSGVYEILFILIRNVNINKKASYYESVEVRIDYFETNKDDLNIILDIMNNNKMIEEINRYSICSSRLHQYKLKHNYILCSNEKLGIDLIEKIDNNIIEKIYNMRLEQVRLNKTSDGIPVEYDFRLISTSFYIVKYGYCIEYSECNTESNYTKLFDEGYIIKNKIDKNWYTSYHNLPAL